MQLDQFSIFFIIALLAATITLFLSFSAQRLRPSPGITPFSWLMLLISIWCSSIAFGMLSQNEWSAFLWIVVRMSAVFFVPVAWLAMVIQYTGREALVTSRSVLFTSLVPLLSVGIFLSNNTHHLFFTEIEYIRSGPFLVDETWHLGPYFYFHLLYSYTLILIGDVLLLREAFRMADQHRRKAVILVMATAIPLIFNVSYVFHLIPGLKVNYDPLGFVFVGLIMGWGIYFNKLFDLSPFARGLLVDSMADGMIVVNQRGLIVDTNPAAERIFGFDKENIGTPAHELFHKLDLENLELSTRDYREQIKLSDRKGKDHYYEIHVTPIFGQNVIRGRLITIRNITAQKLVEEQLQYLAITDALTGLANHRHFYELLDQEQERARRSHHPFSVIMFDIDLFKQVNDTHGHLVGDQVLREIATICKHSLRQYDIICRYGGEEFSMILPNTPLQDAAHTADRLRRAVATHEFQIEDIEFNLTISLGVSCYNPENPLPPKSLVDQADQSLYYSKQNGRNRVTTFEQIIIK